VCEVSSSPKGAAAAAPVGLNAVSGYLEAIAPIRGVLGRLSCVEFCVAAEEDALQLPADGRPVAAAVVLH